MTSSTEPGSQGAPSADRQATAPRNSPHATFWIRELPFSLVLILTLLGVAYTSFVKQPIVGFWEILAPVIGLVCIGAGWLIANDNKARLRLIFTQALHWLAFLLVMNMLLLPSVQKILNPSATALAILTLLALGTFTAGVQVLSWQVCLLGVILAGCVPAAAWIEASALIVVLIAVAVLGIGAVVWWHWHEARARKA